MRRNYYAGDPRWIEARFNSCCKGCNSNISKGSKAHYYPSTRDIFCAKCGDACERDFYACVHNEEFMSG